MTSIYLDVNFYIKKRKVTQNFVKQIADALVRNGAEYSIMFGYSKWHVTDFKDAPLDESIRVIGNSQGSMEFGYKDIYFTIHIIPDVGKYFGRVWLSLSRNLFISSNPNHKRNSQQLIEVATIIWNALPEKPVYGYVDLSSTFSDNLDIEEEITKHEIMPPIIPPRFWMNFYGSSLVEKIGREKLMAAPVYNVKRIDDGILLLIGKTSNDDYDYHKLLDYFGWKSYIICFNYNRNVELGKTRFETIEQAKPFLENEIQEFRKKFPKHRIMVGIYVPPELLDKSRAEFAEVKDWLSKKLKVESVSLL